MGQFKPMVKMTTTEPSVILKLKKGGKVAAKSDYKAMHEASESPSYEAAEHGKSPKKPSMSARRLAMNPQMYAKGGKATKKMNGGVMPMAAAAPQAALGRRRMAAVPVAMGSPAVMKKGGKASCEAVDKKLESHKSMPASKAHMQKKADGGSITASMDKTTVKGNAGKFVNTVMATADKKGGTPKVFAVGGTVEGNAKKFADTKVVTSHRDPGYEKYKNGGSAKKAYATGGNVVDDGKAEKMPRRPTSRPVANSLQSGTFKRGGKVMKSEGGDVEDKYAPWSKEKSEAYKKSLPMASRTDPEAEAIKSAHEKKMNSYYKEQDRQERSFYPRYSKTAVDKAIASSNRSGRKIRGKEAKAIHALLKGRASGGSC